MSELNLSQIIEKLKELRTLAESALEECLKEAKSNQFNYCAPIHVRIVNTGFTINDDGSYGYLVEIPDANDPVLCHDVLTKIAGFSDIPIWVNSEW